MTRAALKTYWTGALLLVLSVNCSHSFGDLVGASTSGSDALFGLNTNTGQATEIGLTGINSINGLAYDSSTGVLFGVDTFDNNLVSINIKTGMGTVIGPTGFNAMSALAYDSNADILYATDGIIPRALFSIDRSTGEGTLVTNLNIEINGMAFDASNDLLYGVHEATKSLWVINRETGSNKFVASFDFRRVHSIAFNPADGLVYGLANSGDQLIAIDPVSGGSWSVGPTGTTSDFGGFAFVPIPEPTSLTILFAVACVLGLRKRRA